MQKENNKKYIYQDEPAKQMSPSLLSYFGTRMKIHVMSVKGGDDYSILECYMPAGVTSGTHLHIEEEETIHLREGELELELLGQRSIIKAGDSIYLPKGAAHNLSNKGNVEARFFLVHSKGQFADFVNIVGRPLGIFPIPAMVRIEANELELLNHLGSMHQINYHSSPVNADNELIYM